MLCKFWKRCGLTLGVASTLLCGGRWVSAQEAKPAEPRTVEVQIQGDAPHGVFRVRLQKEQEGDETRVAAPSEYWIGVQLNTLDELALSQLNLKQGVAAETVYPDSPAAKAGLQKYDILLQFGDTTIATPDDLIRAVEKTKDNPVALKLLRGGKEETVKITAVKRQAAFELKLTPKLEDARRIEAWVERLHKGEPGKDPVHMHFFRPGVVLGDRLVGLEFPKDLNISINKQGSEPAKVSVKKGDKSWDVTADKVAELPADVRPFVESLLAQLSAAPVRYFLDAQGKDPAFTGLKVNRVAPPLSVPATPRVQAYVVPTDKANLEAVAKQLQEALQKIEELRQRQEEENAVGKMKQAVDQLRKELDELRKKSAQP